MLEQIIRHQPTQVGRRSLAFANGMGTIRVGHHRELFFVSYQLVDQQFHRLVVTIVIASTVDEQEIALVKSD